MSTTTTQAEPKQHTKLLGETRYWCIQKHCDGIHHVWCSCSRRAA
jgi:hypothetical protein